MDQTKLDDLCINTIRMLAVDAVEKAKSGHPGMPMGAAAIAYVLWTKFLRHNPRNPSWPNRDRFVLSAGHGSTLLYSLLYLTGYDMSLEDIKNFRQWGSKTPGHPEYDISLGIETTTGPLGQGFGTGVGMAIAQRYLADYFNRPGYPLFDYYIYAIVSDGDLMEGVSSEAASLAGHLKLGKIIYIYDDNHITIEGSTELTFSEDVGKKFTALGWQVQNVDGYDLEGIARAITNAQQEKKKPSLIIARTHIAYGSPNKQDTAASHGAPLGPEEVKLTKQNLNWPLEPEFYVPQEALDYYRKAIERGKIYEQEWQNMFESYSKEFPELAQQWQMFSKRELGETWKEKIPKFEDANTPVATRSASGKVLNAIAPYIPNLIGGSADLAPSNQTYLNDYQDFGPETSGRNLHFGIREHAMGTVLNGIALSQALIPYGGTFLVFSDYMRPAIRMAAMMKLPVIYVFTHDSIGLGEDGPTHQPIEHLPSLRTIPNLTVIRPADATETAVAWEVALEHRNGPVALILTRQKLPIIDRKKFASATGLKRGAYVLVDPPEGRPEVILLATGSEVHLALEAYEELTNKKIATRVVSMPSWELFEKQPQSYRDEILLPQVTARLAIEASYPLSWRCYVGLDGDILGITTFGASAPYKILFEKYGFTVDNVVAKVEAILARVNKNKC